MTSSRTSLEFNVNFSHRLDTKLAGQSPNIDGRTAILQFKMKLYP